MKKLVILVVIALNSIVLNAQTLTGSKLEISSTDSHLARFYYNDNATNQTRPRLDIWGTANKINLRTTYGNGGAHLSFGTHDVNDALFISQSGHIGIGTDSPDTKLHIYEGSAGGGGYTNTNLRIENDGVAFLEFLTPINKVQGIMFSDKDATYRGYIRYNHADNSMRLWTNGSEKFTILSSGNVGIGTTNPTDKLYIHGGDIATTGKLSLQDNSAAIGDIISLYGDRFDAPNMYGLGVESSTLYYKSYGFHRWYINTNANGGSNAKMVLDASKLYVSNKLAVGTTTIPSDYKLAVAGKIIAKEVKVTLDGWSDFVFQDNYQLKTLTEVEDYITQNKHLPDVPSAAEVEENGVSLGEMDAVLLQKIEELTLYIIEQEKNDDLLQKELSKLKIENSKLKTENNQKRTQDSKRLSDIEDKLNNLETIINQIKN